MLDTIIQHPSENLRYEVNYSKWLDEDRGEVLSGVTATVNNITNPFLNVLTQLSPDQKAVYVTIFGGKADEDYQVSLLATTTLNQKDRDCIGVLIRETC